MIENLLEYGIISPTEAANLNQKTQRNIVFLDATFVLPTSTEDIKANYHNKRIPNALFFDIKSIANRSSKLPHMLPHHSTFEKAVSELGVSNDDIIIIYGQHGMLMGPARVWWMFKGFGHINTLVLDGGLPYWEKKNLPLGRSKTAKAPQSFSEYKASAFNPDMIMTMDEMIEASQNDAGCILDARPQTRFDGSSPEPRESMRSGHIPTSRNLPASCIVCDDGTLKSNSELQTLFRSSGIDTEADSTPSIMTTCGSGITACALSLALFSLGTSPVRVYDGSWSEWGLESSPTCVEKT